MVQRSWTSGQPGPVDPGLNPRLINSLSPSTHRQASLADHPFDSLAVSGDAAFAIARCLENGPTKSALHQAETLARWKTLSAQLEPANDAFCAKLHKEVRPFAARKKPLLLKAILDELNFPDEAATVLHDCMANGFPAFGRFPRTGLFPEREHRATATREDLMKSAAWAKPALINSRSRAEKPEVRDALWKVTMDERKRGECLGPFTAEELDKIFPGGWLAVHRFPVYQKGKPEPRACDNFSIFGHNSTSDTSETIDTESSDTSVAIGKCWVSTVVDAPGGKFAIVSLDGKSYGGFLHESSTKESVEQLTARLIDLKRAYKQLARSPRDAELCIFALQDEHGVWHFFIALALGFGARNAVFGFNLAARAIRFILCRGLWVSASHFFDDFSHVQPEAYCKSNSEAVEQALHILGWDYKDGPEDLLPPRPVFSPLGVQVCFREHGYAVVSNTPKRREKILSSIDELTAADKIDHDEVVSLIGVCNFAEAQTSGRTGAVLLKAVRRSLTSSNSTQDLRAALVNLREHTVVAVPRVIRLTAQNAPVLVFTDAAFENGRVTVGGCLFDKETGRREFFGGRLSGGIIQTWLDEGKEQLICQGELFAVPLALWIWRQVITQRNVLVFVDNEPAKDALIRGASSSLASSQMVRQCRLLCAQIGAGPWFCRVASPSNLADGPSRADNSELLALGASEVFPEVPPHFPDAIVLQW